MGLVDVRCALSGMSSIGQKLRLVWVCGGRPVGPVPCGHSNRALSIDFMDEEPHQDAQRLELRRWSVEGRMDMEATQGSYRAFRRHHPHAPVFEMLCAIIASSQVGGGGPMVLDGETVEMVPVIASIAEAAAGLAVDGPARLCTTGDAFEDAIARGVLSVYGELGGTFPFRPVVDQLHIDDQDVFEAQREEAVQRLARWPILVEAVRGVRYG